MSVDYDVSKYIEDSKFEALAGLVSVRSGLGWGPRGRAALRRALELRLKALGLPGLSAYNMALKKDPAEWPRLVSLTADSDTAFFGNPMQFEAVGQGILPDLTLRREERRLTLVSAGCSTGEEAYTLAMTVRESGLLNKDWRVRIFALDIDAEAIERARSGFYPAEAVQTMSEQRLQRWFRRRGERYQVKDEIREMVVFDTANLADPEEWPWPKLIGAVDLVLLRNVLIDLAPLTGKRITDFMAELLAPDGVLLTGPVEGLPYGGDRFIAEHWGGIIFSRKHTGRIKANPVHVPRKSRRGGPAKIEEATAEFKPLTHYVSSALEQGSDALAHQGPDKAMPFFEAALDESATAGELCIEAIGLAARAHLEMERWAEARDLVTRIINFGEDRPWARMLLGETWAGEGRRARAKGEWEKALDHLRRIPASGQDPYFLLDPSYARANPVELLQRRLADA